MTTDEKTFVLKPVHQALILEGLQAFLEMTQKARAVQPNNRSFEIQEQMIKETIKKISE